MSVIAETTVLTNVEHILGSGSGTLDFAISGKEDYYTWHGAEDADWTVEDVEYVENIEEDRIILYPEGECFTCEIEATEEEFNSGPVHCFCE